MAAAPSQVSRRAFLRAGPPTSPRRPPGAVDEAGFLARCSRCDACVGACPEHIIVRGAGGYPELAAAECTFCAACSDVCEAGALDLRSARSWRWQVRIDALQCLAAGGVVCQSCRDACPHGALRFSGRLLAAPALDGAACNGCGACVPACPTGAVSLFESVAEEAIA